MTATRIFFTIEIPDFGGSVVVKEERARVVSKMRVAERGQKPTFEVTNANSNKKMDVRVALVGLIADN